MGHVGTEVGYVEPKKILELRIYKKNFRAKSSAKKNSGVKNLPEKNPEA